jgi:hypothetical protein
MVPCVVRESIEIAASAWDVYDLIADVAGVGAHSSEATGALRVGNSLPAVGESFWGSNRRGPWVWVTRCRITTARRGEAFAFDVDLGPLPISHWAYRITPLADDRCSVTETWIDRRTGLRGALVARAGSVIIPGPRDEHNRRNIQTSLAGLKLRAESARTP